MSDKGMHVLQLQRIVLSLAVVLIISGCTRREPKHEEIGLDSSRARQNQPRENPAVVIPPSPPQPSGPQIGKSDSLMNAIAPKLTDWVAMWRAALPGFQVDSTWGGRRESWPRIHVGPIDDDLFRKQDEEDVTFELLGLPSPGGRHLLYIDRYQSIAADGDMLEVGGDVDSQPLLIDRRAKSVATLHACGTPCGFHWGTWLSPTRFALAGWQDADDFSRWKQGQLEIYSVSDSTVITYVTRIVSADDYARYEAAWEGWLLKRYREMKAHRRGT